ncbi:MAG: AIM24 family protein [Pseudobutyrivibrio sp.]|nr:AIM24 family protein [Pseudobutyrivibrio sp.]
MNSYFASKMNLKTKQVIASLNDSGVIVQSGAMQMCMGNINASTDISSATDLLKKFVGSKVTGESAIKPKYVGNGIVVLEPTKKYIILENIGEWNGGMIIEDELFLACEETVKMSIVPRNTISSAVLGGEGLFNTRLEGNGIVALESKIPREELVAVELIDDILKIDGNMAIAWSNSLKFSVEKTTKTLIGSAASGEGFVNVYSGTGRVLLAPIN